MMDKFDKTMITMFLCVISFFAGMFVHQRLVYMTNCKVTKPITYDTVVTNGVDTVYVYNMKDFMESE